jgi:release factor glutamine methyltransferase
VSETVGAALRRGAATLAAAGVETPVREARLLLAHALGVTAADLLDRDRILPRTDFDVLLERRAAREPNAFIVGRQGFWTHDLAVTPATLIPRADTETLIEALRDLYPQPGAPESILDLGTGTGALLLAALSLFPAAWGVGLDIVPQAAKLAACNAIRVGMAERAMFLVADWTAPIAGRFDVVLANPPYIASDDLRRLAPEVALYEPRSALDGGTDGLAAYRVILPTLSRVLGPSGVAIIECGSLQAAQVIGIAQHAGLGIEGVRRDLGGNERAVVLRA